jgi:hypothetical protein
MVEIEVKQGKPRWEVNRAMAELRNAFFSLGCFVIELG